MKKTRVTIVCSVCGISFEVIKCREKTAKTCSKKCFARAMLGHRPYNFKGGRLTHKGYVYIMVKGHPAGDRDGYVPEHRLVMEKSIGRYLTEKEIVHHKNAKRDDNRIENLELIENQSLHMKEHGFGHMVDYTKVKHPWLGRKHSEETKAHWRKIRKGRRLKKGEKLTNQTIVSLS